MHVKTTDSRHVRLRTLGVAHARIQGGFWAERQQVNLTCSLMHAFDKLEAAGNFNNLSLAQGKGAGKYREPLFMDSDIYKWLEAVGYALACSPNAELRAKADYAVRMLAQTQQEDGYLNSYYQALHPERFWQDLTHGHELYCAGHLFEAAVAFRRGARDDSLLEIAVKCADLIDREFGPNGRQSPPGHPEIELALVELARETGEIRYLKLADFFLAQRGRGALIGPRRFRDSYYQDRVPVGEATVLEGHAVRQLYLASGMTDVYLETGDPQLWLALERLWQDLATRKLHITGGVGARRFGEAFGKAYELPNDTTYCETCAAIANVMWNWRMLLATGEARYAEMMERSLYNCVLAGVSLNGTRYFYENPLSSPGGLERPSWYGCACCPPNLMRLVALIAHHCVTFDAHAIQIHQFMDGTFRIDGAFGACVLRMETEYPHQGEVDVTFAETPARPVALAVRVPSWARATMRFGMAGADVGTRDEAQGYHWIRRAWQPGDRITISMALEPRLTVANPRVDATRGALAIERGPLVYCLEATDNAEAEHLADLRIDPHAPLTERFEAGLLGGVHVITARGWRTSAAAWNACLYQPYPVPDTGPTATLSAVPYYAWANRGAGAMQVWIPRGRQP